LPTLTAGGLVTTLENRSFDPDELLKVIATSRAQVVAIVGDAVALPIVRTLDAGPSDRAGYDTESLRVICSAGVAWTPPIKQRLLDHLPSVTLLDSCGSTEGVAYGVSQVRKGDPVVAGNFEAAPGLVVLDGDGREVPLGETGLLAGPTTASGYFRDPEKTAATFRFIDRVRYAIPGDLGRIELDGTVTLIGRGVSTINTGTTVSFWVWRMSGSVKPSQRWWCATHITTSMLRMCLEPSGALSLDTRCHDWFALLSRCHGFPMARSTTRWLGSSCRRPPRTRLHRQSNRPRAQLLMRPNRR
jgi:hypothetical protein